jgi:AraC-like DNA-binding protein
MRPAFDRTTKTRLLLRPVRCALGTLRQGGMNQGGFGVGRPPGPRRELPYYGIVFILNGAGQYADASTPLTNVRKGDVIVFFPGRPHQCGTRPNEFWDELWFEFEGPAFDLLRDANLLDPRRPVHHPKNLEHWFRRFFELIPPLHLRQKTPPQVTVSRFVAALTELLSDSQAPDETPAPQDDWLSEACDLLATHDTRPGSEPAVVARKLGLSYETFRKKFTRAIGFSPGRYHLDSRIDRAAALLHQGRHTIKEIAAELDFCDEFYFSRYFKRRLGQSPRAFRERLRGTTPEAIPIATSPGTRPRGAADMPGNGRGRNPRSDPRLAEPWTKNTERRREDMAKSFPIGRPGVDPSS